jgi:hypothetical protein
MALMLGVSMGEAVDAAKRVARVRVLNMFASLYCTYVYNYQVQ